MSFSRRGLWGIAAGVGLGVAVARLPITTEGKKKRQRNKNPKLKRNEFGCVAVGGKCLGNDANCCSGICEGKKPKKGKKDRSRCIAHNVGGYQPDEDICGGIAALCGSEEERGICSRTTGGASFCGRDGDCRNCTKDTDCEAEFGPGAACVVCSECEETGSTSCGAAAV